MKNVTAHFWSSRRSHLGKNIHKNSSSSMWNFLTSTCGLSGMDWFPLFLKMKQNQPLLYRAKSDINKRIVNDDLILLCSALHIGPTAYVLSNDQFLDHILCDDIVLPIFEIWKKSRVIRHMITEGKATVKVKFFEQN